MPTETLVPTPVPTPSEKPTPKPTETLNPNFEAFTPKTEILSPSGLTAYDLGKADFLRPSPNIIFDSNGDPQIVFSDSDGGLTHVFQVNGKWYKEKISTFTAGYNSITYESGKGVTDNGLVVAANDGWAAEALVLAKYNATSNSWETTILPGIGSSDGLDSSITSHNGKLYISAYSWSEGKATLSTNESGPWKTSALAISGWAETKILINNKGQIHVLYGSRGTGHIYDSSNTSGKFVETAIKVTSQSYSFNGTGGEANLAATMDKNSGVISLFTGDSIYSSKGGWHKEATIIKLSKYERTQTGPDALVKDANGHLHLVFYAIDKKEKTHLFYADNVTGKWRVIDLDNKQGVQKNAEDESNANYWDWTLEGSPASIAMGPDGKAYIVFATRAPQTPDPKVPETPEVRLVIIDPQNLGNK